MDSPVVEVLTEQMVKQIVDENNERLKVEIATMLDAKLDAFRTIIDGKASHTEVDEKIAQAVAPLSKKIDDLAGLINSLVSSVAEVKGIAITLTNVKSADMQMIRDKQVETDRQVDVLRIQLAGVAGDAQLLMSDVRGAARGEGNPSLFERIDQVIAKLDTQEAKFTASLEERRREFADLHRIVDADHKLIEMVRSLGLKSLKAALKASWQAFTRLPVQAQAGSVVVTVLGAAFVSGSVNGWIVPVLEWLLEQLR